MRTSVRTRPSKALMSELDRLKPLFASRTDYVFAKDLSGRYVSANAAYLAALNKEAADLVGATDATVFPPADADELQARERLVHLCGHTLENEMTLPFNGQARNVMIRRSAWRDAAGQVIGTIGIATDITQTREGRLADGRHGLQTRGSNARLQQMLADQRRFSRRMVLMLDAGRELVATLDSARIRRVAVDVVEQSIESAASAFALFNQSTNSWTFQTLGLRGCALGEVGDTYGSDAAPFSDDVLRGRVFRRPRLRAGRGGFDAAVMAGGLTGYVALPVTCERDLRAVLLAVWSDDGFPLPEDLWLLESLSTQVSLALHNAALYEQLGASLVALKRVQEQARRAEHLKALGQVASGVAHDFNNSLTTILGLSDWLLHELPAETPFYSDLETIRTAAVDAAAMVRRLQVFGRLRADVRGEFAETVDLADVARAVAELTRPRCLELSAAAGHHFGVRVEADSGPLVPGAPGELRELLVNLVFNGLDAMPDGGVVRVTAGVKDGRATVCVIDTGVGMPDDVKSRLFEPFFSTKGHRGNGLGLSMCASIAARHDARLSVESAPGAGATFVLTFETAVIGAPPHVPAAGGEDVARPGPGGRGGLRLVHSSEAES
jgi:PAS domain S-box-containing protein